jgi:hypothetical protein
MGPAETRLLDLLGEAAMMAALSRRHAKKVADALRNAEANLKDLKQLTRRTLDAVALSRDLLSAAPDRW